MKSGFKSLAIAGLLSITTLGALAQEGSSTMEDHHSMMNSQRMQKRNPEKMQAMVEKHMADLKSKLKISSEQEGAWATFHAAMKPNNKMQENKPDPAEMENLSTPQRIEKMKSLRKQHMAEMNAMMEKREESIKTFYAVLTPEQKKTFDQEHARMMNKNGKRNLKHLDN